MQVNIISSSRYKVDRKNIRNKVKEFLNSEGLGDWIVNIVFIGKTKMKKISLKYKQENVALPVLSFPYSSETLDEKLLGEIYICYPQVVLLAAEKDKTVDYMLNKLLLHGLKNLVK